MPEFGSVAERYCHLIGQEYVYTSSEEVGRASIRKFAMAVGDLNPLYLDREQAVKGPYGDVVAPPTFICETTQYYRGQIDEEGGFTDRVRFPMGQPIRAGNEYSFYKPLRPDDVITARSKIRNIYEREGRTGHLLFMELDITYTDQRGELLAENRESFVYRLAEPDQGAAKG